jgi:lysophospholipase L1-like esterase
LSDLRWVVVVPVALLVVAASAEALARSWIRRRKLYYVHTPGLRLLLHPHRDVFPQLEPSIRFEVNGEGERGDDVPRVGPGETLYRVLVAGGSQPEGYLLDQDTTWPGALQRLLERPEYLRRLGASRVHVGSIARSGIGSEALELILDRVLVRYPRLQAIIILVGASDVLRWLEQGAPPFPPSSSETSDVFRCHPELAFGWKPSRLALVEQLLRLRRSRLRPVDVNKGAGGWIGKARAMRARAKVIRTTMPDPEAMLSHFERHFRQVLRKAKAHADRVIVARQPWFDRECTADEAAHMWHGGVGQAWKEEVSAYFSHDVLRRLMSLLDGRAARVAEELEVEQLDIRDVVEPSLENYYDFFHATPAGARAVASAVAMTMVRLPLPSADELTAPKRAS